MKGKAIQVVGIRFIFTHIFTNACMIMRDKIHIQIVLSCGSGTFLRCFSTYRNIRIYSQKRIIFPNNQTSSENAAKMKSQYDSGRFVYFCNQFQYQFHRNHHHQIAINA